MKNDTQLAYQLIHTGKRLKQRIKELSAPGEQQAIPYQLLSLLDKQGKSLRELAELMRCSKQEVSRQVQRAEKLGWIVLTADPNDGRSKRVFFSENGKMLMRQGIKHYKDLESSWEKQLGREKIHTLKQLLTELNEII